MSDDGKIDPSVVACVINMLPGRVDNLSMATLIYNIVDAFGLDDTDWALVKKVIDDARSGRITVTNAEDTETTH